MLEAEESLSAWIFKTEESILSAWMFETEESILSV
jgi:hypothetical protein